MKSYVPKEDKSSEKGFTKRKENYSHKRGSWISRMAKNPPKEIRKSYIEEASSVSYQKENAKLKINGKILPSEHKKTQVHSNAQKKSFIP